MRAKDTPSFPYLTNGGEMGARIRRHDWAATPLGPMEGWPPSLKVAVGIMLQADSPIGIYWGVDLTLLYNDAWRELVGDKHPGALGRPARLVFAEIWDEIGPMFADVLRGRGSVHAADRLLRLDRGGRTENTWFDFSFHPIPLEDGAIGGILNIAAETSAHVLEARRARLRDELAERLRAVRDPSALAFEAAALLGRHLAAGHAAYAEVDGAGEHAVITRDWSADGMASHAGRHRLSAFGGVWVDDLKAGRSLVVGDVRQDPRTARADLGDAFERFRTRALLVVPLFRDGRLVAMLVVGAHEPRDWHQADVALAEDVAERVNEAIERARTEAALEESEARARRIVEGIADGLMTVDLDWRVTFINSRGEQIVRPLSGAAEDMLGCVLWDVFPGVDETPFGVALREAMAQRIPTAAEGSYPALGGWFYTRCYPLAGGLAIYFLDVSARVRAEAGLLRTHSLLQGITQGTDDLIAAIGSDFRVLFLNETYRGEYKRLWNHELQLGDHLLEPMSPWPDERRKAEQIWSRALAGEAFSVVMEFGPTENRQYVYDLRFSPVRDEHGRQIGAAHILRDVTEQKRLEGALRQSEARFRALVVSTSNVVYRMSPDWSELHQLHGRGFLADTAARRDDWIDAYIHPEDQPQLLAAIGEALRTKGIFDLEHRVRRIDGSTGWLRSRAVPLLDDQGEIVEWFGAASDISERRRAEQHQAMLMAELDHRVKNVLAVVQSIVRQTLQDERGAGSDAADRLVGRLSALAQSHALLATGRWEGASLRHLVENAVAPYRGDGVARVHVEGEDLHVTPKAAQTLALALHELATNAAKHGALSKPDGRLVVAWALIGEACNGRLVLRWTERGGPPVEGPPQGRGFGSRLIEGALAFELDGDVELDFAPEGLTAVVDLPLHRLRVSPGRDRGSTSSAAAPPSAAAEVLAGRRILLVEDQHLVAEPVMAALSAAGCCVTGPASSLEHALRAAATVDVDAAVLDVNLNGEFVWPAARILQSRGIPFVFATGYSGTVLLAPELTQAPWLEKPIEPERLVSVLAALVAPD